MKNTQQILGIPREQGIVVNLSMFCLVDSYS
jgi:hypothetical protein